MYLKEWVRRLPFREFVIRIWVDAEKVPFNRQMDALEGKVAEVYDDHPTGHSDLATRIMDACPELNAVEVLTHSGEGVVLYRDWP